MNRHNPKQSVRLPVLLTTSASFTILWVLALSYRFPILHGSIRTPECPLYMVEFLWYLITFLLCGFIVKWPIELSSAELSTKRTFVTVALFYVVSIIGVPSVFPKFRCFGMVLFGEWRMDGLP